MSVLILYEMFVQVLCADSSAFLFYLIAGENAQREKWPVTGRCGVSGRVVRKHKELGARLLCPQLPDRKSKAPEGLSSPHLTKLQGPPEQTPFLS